MSSPLIFIHKWNSDYLFYILTSARLYNPDKRIVLLGDELNSYLSRLGIEHVPYQRYDTGERLSLFDQHFECIAGSEWKGREWLHFVFRRWFLMYNFIEEQGIESFWTFDSDTIILTDLDKQEHKFADYDCTTQCNDHCMNGFIRSRQVVAGYLDKNIEIFQRKEFLEQERARISQEPKSHFNEMRTFDIYREESKLRCIRSASIIDGETFDEAICLPDDMEVNVFDRDRHSCSYMTEDGKRCCSSWDLELDHIVPRVFGETYRAEDLRVLCRSHNVHAAERVFGRNFMQRCAEVRA